jgi:hypothetical protein
MNYKITAVHPSLIKIREIFRLSFLLCLVLCFFVAGIAYGLEAEEYRIKSAYLEKITRFIQWPVPSADNSNPPFFVIGIAGVSPLEGVLEGDYKDRRIKDKPVRIVRIFSPEGVKACDLLFIAGSEEDELDSYIQKAKQFHVLTVGDTAGFAQRGVHINFYIEDQKVRFSINPESMKQAGLNAGSLLLDYAKIVRSNQ